MYQLNDALAYIVKNNLNLIGVMTHFRSADVMSSELFWQLKNFEEVKCIARLAGFTNIRFHSHNSAALIRSSHFNEDIARCGIGIYGYSELPYSYTDIGLKPVLSLWANRISTRGLTVGEKVGYGGCYKSDGDTVISTYDIGYGDGWMRGNCHKPYVTPDNLSILGKVSMDFISLKGDKSEICLMNNAQVSAKQYQTISYEMTTMLSKDIARFVT